MTSPLCRVLLAMGTL